MWWQTFIGICREPELPGKAGTPDEVAYNHTNFWSVCIPEKREFFLTLSVSNQKHFVKLKAPVSQSYVPEIYRGLVFPVTESQRLQLDQRVDLYRF